MWQKCPICAGTGTTHNPLSAATSETCSVCKGFKIISQLSGLPPNSKIDKPQLVPVQFRDPGWECSTSPTGHCDYEQEDGSVDEDCCRYCGEPEERK